MAIQHYTKNTNFEGLVWNISESPEFFMEQLQLSTTQCTNIQEKYKHPTALKQWLASRHSLQLLFQTSFANFHKNTHGKLELADSQQQLSISHSDDYIAVVKASAAIGVDIQTFNPKLSRIASKFIAKELLSQLQKSSLYQDYLHVYWGIKEALFKAYGLGQVNFINHLHIHPFEIAQSGTTTAQISKPNFKATYHVFYEKTEDYYLCVVTKQ